MGAGWAYAHPSEIASLSPIYRGVRYDRLESYKTLQWPVAEDGRDEPVLYLTASPFPMEKLVFGPYSFAKLSDSRMRSSISS